MWLRKFDVFELPCDYRIEVSRDFVGATPHPESAPYQVLLREHVIDVSRDFVGGILLS